ncbi:MAG: hypothetical protein K2X98_05065 [Alphaproteobacteria bacterium]|nr:hypothetical protein [Alphaproteobacteria bacterium]
MRKKLVTLILVVFMGMPIKASACDQTELYNLFNQFLANQTYNITPTQNTNPQQTAIIAGLVLAGHIIPPLWEKFIKPVGGTLIDAFVSTYKKCRSCREELQKDSIETFIEEDQDITDGTQKVLSKFFNALDKEIEAKSPSPLYSKVERPHQDGFVFILPNIRVELTSALHTQDYEKFDAPKMGLGTKVIQKFFRILGPYIEKHIYDYGNFCEDLKKMKAHGTLQFYDIKDPRPDIEDAIVLEFGTVISKKSLPLTETTDDNFDLQKDISAVFSSRYRIKLTAHDIPEEKTPRLVSKSRANLLSKILVDDGSHSGL